MSLGPGVELSITDIDCVRCEETVGDLVGPITFDATVAPDMATGCP